MIAAEESQPNQIDGASFEAKSSSQLSFGANAMEPESNSEPLRETTPSEVDVSSGNPDEISYQIKTDSDANQLIDEEGGEWDLLLSKIGQWWERNNLSSQWEQLSKPIFFLIGFAVIAVAAQIYGKVLGSISRVPIAPRLFELVGIIWFVRFSTKNLIRNEDRKKLVEGLKDRVQRFL